MCKARWPGVQVGIRPPAFMETGLGARIPGMHKGTPYPTAYRRDFVTQLPFPNLWPDRIIGMQVAVSHLPGPRWADLVDTLSEAGFVPDNLGVMVYVFLIDDGTFVARLQWTIQPLNHPPYFRNKLLFTDNAVIGMALLEFDVRCVDPNYTYWNGQFTMPASDVTLTKTGGFNLVTVDNPFSMNSNPAGWNLNPDGWWNGH